jgi:cytoskeleton protein RodZ
MGELGELLRSTREEKRITLEEAENVTRIRAKYLLALEEGRYDDLPTPGHVHGFLRNYATYVGLDMRDVETLYAKETSGRRLFEPGIFQPKDIALSPQKPLIKADIILGLVVAVVVIVVGGWMFWQYGWPLVRPVLSPTATPSPTVEQAAAKPTFTAVREIMSMATSTPLASTATSAPPTDTPISPTATPTEPPPIATPTLNAPLVVATPTPLPTPTPTRTPTRAQGVTLGIEVIERTWLQVSVDGQELPGELLEAGQKREWQAEQQIYFICGNAGGVEVTVNGEVLGTLGEPAQVVEKTWTPGGEVIPTPAIGGQTASSTPTVTAAP